MNRESNAKEQQVKQEVLEGGKEVVSNHKQRLSSAPDYEWYYHNTRKLLTRYRRVMTCIARELEDIEETCLQTFGTRFDGLEEFAKFTDVNLSGTKIESRARNMVRNRQMVQEINQAVNDLRKYDLDGEEFYWILYYKYMGLGEDRCRNDTEVIDKLHVKGFQCAKTTLYRRNKAAIQALSEVLWGFVTSDMRDVLDLLCPESREI